MEDFVDGVGGQPGGEGGASRDSGRTPIERVQAGRLGAFLTVLCSVAVMLLVCFIVFSLSVRGEEQVMVPNVVGKELTTALLEMQEKELYPKIQLRYTDANDAGTVLAQSPDAGAIVKAGRRITLTVSRGVISGYIDNYVGKPLADAKGALKKGVELGTVLRVADAHPEGTVLAQSPAAGFEYSGTARLSFVVSAGAEPPTAEVPALGGMPLEQVVAALKKSEVVFDFTAHTAAEGEQAGTVVSQAETGGRVRRYSRVAADVALPEGSVGKSQYGLFSARITPYPYAVPMTLEAVWGNGARETVATLEHTGGNVTIPYVCAREKSDSTGVNSAVTELVLYVAGKPVARETFS